MLKEDLLNSLKKLHFYSKEDLENYVGFSLSNRDWNKWTDARAYHCKNTNYNKTDGSDLVIDLAEERIKNKQR